MNFFNSKSLVQIDLTADELFTIIYKRQETLLSVIALGENSGRDFVIFFPPI